ncbi:VOC family protein [Sphingomonas sp.]|jgi:catechol 2,3-dioxygenase-like lactoylglutathione lyase family enzyme|uniref:VOC family protein n=1 Tax=Sphingomonas sp. TaxID=28214 RepID=UPI002DF072BD|nr:VOC family protein [Sphingomonas sp.]
MMLVGLLLGAAAPASAGPITGIRTIGITVSDIDDTLTFYGKAIPYPVVKRFMVPARAFPARLVKARRGSVEIAVVRMPNMFIQLMDFDPERREAAAKRPVIGPGYTHICFQSPAADPAEPRFRQAGLEMVSRGDKPIDIGGYGVVYSYGRDPDGIMIENEVLTSPKRNDRVWVSHIATVTPDREAMLAFYTRLLGFKPWRTTEQENRKPLDEIADIDNLAIKGGWFGVGNMEIEVWQYARPQTPRPSGDQRLDAIGYNGIGFEVPSLKAEQARLKGLGVRLAGKPMRIGGWSVQYAYDPDGNLFSVQQNVGGDIAESIAAWTHNYPPVR